jgi:hypothetical protein
MQESSRSAISGSGVDDCSSTAVLGASSLIGTCGIPLLIRGHRRVFAFSRHMDHCATEAGATAWCGVQSEIERPIGQSREGTDQMAWYVN